MLIIESIKCYFCSRELPVRLNLPLLTHVLSLRCRHCRKTFNIHVASEDQKLIYSYINPN